MSFNSIAFPSTQSILFALSIHRANKGKKLEQAGQPVQAFWLIGCDRSQSI
ncbi:MAG: hypothetical protein AAFR58_03885 [Cyanobacteria bacterium J06627_28]